MKFIIIIYTTNKLTIVEMEDIRGVRLRKFNLRKIILGVRMHFRHKSMPQTTSRLLQCHCRTSIIFHHGHKHYPYSSVSQ